MSALVDELVDLTAMVMGGGAEARWPGVLSRLEGLRDALRRREAGRRRMPELDAAADWFRRSLYDAKIPDDLRGQAEAIVGEIKATVGAPVVSWTPAPASRPRRNRPSRAPKSGR